MSETRTRNIRAWATRIAITWLVAGLPCWTALVLIVMNWESGDHVPDTCGYYPCGIVAALGMIYLIIPGGAVAALVVLVVLRWKQSAHGHGSSE